MEMPLLFINTDDIFFELIDIVCLNLEIRILIPKTLKNENIQKPADKGDR
jgi:hypothetical protein